MAQAKATVAILSFCSIFRVSLPFSAILRGSQGAFCFVRQLLPRGGAAVRFCWSIASFILYARNVARFSIGAGLPRVAGRRPEMALIADSIFFFFLPRVGGSAGPAGRCRPRGRTSARLGQAHAPSLPSQNVPSDSACVSSSRAGAKIDF